MTTVFLGCSDGSDCGGVFEERAQMTKLGLASPWLATAGVPGLPARVLPLAAPSQSLLHTAATATSPAPIRSYQPPCLPAPTPISVRSRIPPPQCSAPSPLVTQALRNNTAHWLPRHSKPTPLTASAAPWVCRALPDRPHRAGPSSSLSSQMGSFPTMPFPHFLSSLPPPLCASTFLLSPYPYAHRRSPHFFIFLVCFLFTFPSPDEIQGLGVYIQLVHCSVPSTKWP